MTVLVATLVGFLAGRLVWILLRPTLRAELFLRSNFRGVSVPVGAGVVVAVAVVFVTGARAAASAFGAGEGPWDATAMALVVVVVGFALLGLLDDLAADGDDRGFAGHLRALARGRLTTGGLKLVGGGALSIVVAGAVNRSGGGQVVADAALIALMANLGNLFDRAPGRVLKVGGFAFGVLVAATAAADTLVGAAVAVGAALALMRDDLHERLMLGDAGANAIGGAIGLGVVVSTAPSIRLIALAAVFALNAGSELISFSRVIDRVPPLRALDRAGRLP